MTNGSIKRRVRALAAKLEKTSGKTPPKPTEDSAEPVRTGVQTLEVTESEAGMRLDRWFKRRFPTLTLSYLAKILRKGEIRLDGKRAETSSRVEPGQKIRIPPLAIAPVAAPAVLRASSEDARAIQDMTLYEDKYVLALNKPFGLAVQGGSGARRHIDGMLEALRDRNGDRPVLAHRLDRDTSGVLLIAKNRAVAADLGEEFRSRRATKIYWALVEGVPKPARGRISLYLAKGPAMGDARRPVGPSRDKGARDSQERMRIARHGDSEAQHSLTYYACVEKIAPKCAWLSMRPLTGRTHQLRAHAEAIGHPIFGDPKYGRGQENDARRKDPLRALSDQFERKLHLLARRLILPHPKGGMIDVVAPLPPHMEKSWDLLGFDVSCSDPILESPDE